MSAVKELIEEINEELLGLSASEGLVRLTKRFPGAVAFSTAFNPEDQALTYLISRERLPVRIFTLDTGRLFQETYNLMDLTGKKYNVDIKSYFPDTLELENLLSNNGPNGFYESIENRKACCAVRKINPLRRALQGASVWVTGLRAEQSHNRASFSVLEWDEGMGLIKYNPLLNWMEDELSLFLSVHDIPVNLLHKKGFASIGCEPCTRPILPGEDQRAGRWWWESSSKECGLHQVKH